MQINQYLVSPASRPPGPRPLEEARPTLPHVFVPGTTFPGWGPKLG
jgi:hypothetical protein